MTKLVVGAAQLGPADEDKARNVDRILVLLSAARQGSVDLVSFPELALTPYFCLDPPGSDQHSDMVDSDHVQRIVESARRLGIAVVLPMAECDHSGSYNAALVIGPDGDVVGRQRKVHLPQHEQQHFVAGREFAIHPVCNCALGVLICADRAFPESWRVLGLSGAEVVCAPYNTSTRQAYGRPRDMSELEWARDIQATRMRAAAMANGFYIIAAGKGGRERGEQYIADSMIISPWGEIVARARTTSDELVTVEIDLAEVAAFREGGRYSDRRVPTAYNLLTAIDAERGSTSVKMDPA